MRVLWFIPCSGHPDGATFVSGSEDNMVRIWGRHQRQLLEDLDRSHRFTAFSVAYSPDGNTSFLGARTIPSDLGCIHGQLPTDLDRSQVLLSAFSGLQPRRANTSSPGAMTGPSRFGMPPRATCLQALTGHASFCEFSGLQPRRGNTSSQEAMTTPSRFWDAATGKCLQNLGQVTPTL